MKKTEANETTKITKFLSAEAFSKFVGAIEFKIVEKGKRFRLSQMEKHQIESLMAIKDGGLTWKLSDADPRQKPCDVIRLPQGSQALVGVKIMESNMCLFVDIDTLMNQKKSSFTMEELSDIMRFYIRY